jgi:hypothetical protein
MALQLLPTIPPILFNYIRMVVQIIDVAGVLVWRGVQIISGNIGQFFAWCDECKAYKYSPKFCKA